VDGGTQIDKRRRLYGGLRATSTEPAVRISASAKITLQRSNLLTFPSRPMGGWNYARPQSATPFLHNQLYVEHD